MLVARKCPRAGMIVLAAMLTRVVRVPPLLELRIFQPLTSKVLSLLL